MCLRLFEDRCYENRSTAPNIAKTVYVPETEIITEVDTGTFRKIANTLGCIFRNFGTV